MPSEDKKSRSGSKSEPKKKPQKRKESGKDPNRDAKGRFVKGNCANPAGRPKLPEELKKYGAQAPGRLRMLADDPDTPVKVKADIERWFAEMTFGKALQQVDLEGKVDTRPVVFEGEDAIAD